VQSGRSDLNENFVFADDRLRKLLIFRGLAEGLDNSSFHGAILLN
jgi:hypothetical protein